MMHTPAWVKPCTALTTGDVFFIDVGQNKRGRVVSTAPVLGGAFKVVYEDGAGERLRLIMGQDRHVCVVAGSSYPDEDDLVFGQCRGD